MPEKELKPKQKKCIDLLADGNLTQKQIAEKIGVTEQTICNWKRDEIFMASYDAAIRERIRYVSGRALATQISLLDAEPKTAHLAASDLLDRAGFKAPEKLEVSEETVVFCGEDQIKD